MIRHRIHFFGNVQGVGFVLGSMASVARLAVLTQNCPSGNRIVFRLITAQDAQIGRTAAGKCVPTSLPLAVHTVAKVAVPPVPHRECHLHRIVATDKRSVCRVATVRGVPILDNGDSTMSFLRDTFGNRIARRVANRILDEYGNWVYEIRGNRIYDTFGNWIYEIRSNPMGDRIYDTAGNWLYEIRGDRIYDSSGNWQATEF